MAELLIARPADISQDKLDELRKYLIERWKQAERGRSEQVDSNYLRWSKAYTGTPLEKERTVPFYKASNFVVKLIRIYVDTFVARTLNVVFATKPLYVVDGLPNDLKEAWEYYINAKATKSWDHYKIARMMCDRGSRNGSVVFKTTHVTDKAWEVRAIDDQSIREEQVTTYEGPRTRVIPFEDWYVYPFSAQDWEDICIKFHRVRFPEEVAKQQYEAGKWQLSKGKDNFSTYLQSPRDIKKIESETEAGIVQPNYKEFVAVECHLRYALSNDATKLYDIVALIHPGTEELIDLYYSPMPRNLNCFSEYRPFMRDDTWYGESMCEILAQCQEEASVIHNDRRNNSFIANAVCFKRKNGSLLPNPSTNWYPGKVWDLEDMDDLDVISIGRTYEDMIPQEDYVFNLADQLSGIGETMRGTSAGQQGRRGTYNTMGTLSVMAEGNQRQDTNMRDVRSSLGQLVDATSRMQARYGSDDPFIQTLPSDMQPAVNQVFQLLNDERYRLITHEVSPSSAGANSEVEKASLLQMTQVLGQYGATIQQLVPPLLNGQLAPGMKQMLLDIIGMQSAMAKRLLRTFGEAEMVQNLPDVNKILAAGQPQQGPGGAGQANPGGGQGGMEPGGAGDTLPPLSGAGLAAAAALPQQIGGGSQ